MSKYYIRITDTEPLPSEKGLYFELNTDELDGDKFFVVRKNEYNDLVDDFVELGEQFEEVIDNFENSSVVQDAISDIMSDPTFNVQGSTKLVKPNSTNNYTYDSLTTELNAKADILSLNDKLDISDVDDALSSSSINPVQNKVIATELENKSNISHTHDGRYYTETEIDDKLNWKKATLSNMSGCNLYYNSLFCHFTFNAKYSVSTTGQYVKLVSGTIPSSYRPKVVVTIPNDGNMQIRMKITDDGEFMVDTPSKLNSTNLRGSITWARNLP